MRRYCNLQKLRFEERINVDIRYDNDISNYKIPKLLLQPLVENAIIHGIEPLAKEYEISITGKSLFENDRAYILISISDNGLGYNPSEQNDKNHIGILNVNERLKLNYPSSVLTIDSSLYI